MIIINFEMSVCQFLKRQQTNRSFVENTFLLFNRSVKQKSFVMGKNQFRVFYAYISFEIPDSKK